MVAKSFQNMTQLGEPYIVNGRTYVKVRNESTGAERQVRWYSENEYFKMYPEERSSLEMKSQKDVLGFTLGYITIFKGNIEDNLEWFEESNARFCRWWGWYVISTEEIPADLPQDVQSFQIKWEQVGNPNGLLKSETEISAFVDSLGVAESCSEFVGAVGDRLDLRVTVIKNEQVAGYHSTTTIHTFIDNKGNEYIWSTAAKNWAEGEEKTLRGTVKEHRVFSGKKQTVLTRCLEVKL